MYRVGKKDWPLTVRFINTRKYFPWGYLIKVPQFKATGGGPGVKNHVWLFLKISWSSVRGKKPHQKILFVTRDMIFWKSRFAGNYYRCPVPKLQIAISHFAPRYTSCEQWTPYMLGCWHFVCTFPEWHSTNLIAGFWKFYFFRFLQKSKVTKKQG